MYKVRQTREFKTLVRKLLSNSEIQQLQQYRSRLKKNPWIGDAIGPIWFREVRIGGKRVYFFIDEDLVLLAKISNKNNQQELIDAIRERLVAWKDELQRFKTQ